MTTLKHYLNKCLTKRIYELGNFSNETDSDSQNSTALSILQKRILAARTFKRDEWLDNNLKYFNCHKSTRTKEVLSLSKQFSSIEKLQELFVIGHFKNNFNTMLGNQ